MPSLLFAPQPQRPPKRRLPELDPELEPLRKQPRLLFPLPPPTTTNSSASSQLKPTRKRVREDVDANSAPYNKHRRLGSPSPRQLPTVRRSNSAPPWPRPKKQVFGDLDSDRSLVDAWLVQISQPDYRPSSPPSNRPGSCPAVVDINIAIHTSASLADIKQMSQNNGETMGAGSVSSRSDNPGTSHPLYRTSLYHNGVIYDYSGEKMPDELRKYVETKILKQRESHELDNHSVSKVIEVAAKLAESAESQTSKLIRTAMFPIEHDGIVEGGNTQWSTAALPNNPQYVHTLSAPKPDVHLGYPHGQGSDWSLAQENVMDSTVARPYALPARGNAFPFFMIEVKSEPTGGTLHVAENQAAGSGSHSVNALLWLFKEAGLAGDLSVTETVAFSAAVNHRHAMFYVHWYSEKESLLYMSCFESYSTRKSQDIRACNSTVRNIIGHGLGARREIIGKALTSLYPYPDRWKQRRSTANSRSASVASFTEGSRPSKVPRPS